MTGMRTTVRIDDALYRAVKARAAASGRTVGDVIEDALRHALRDRDRQDDDLPPLPTFGAGGTLPGVDLADGAALRDLMDAGEDVDALR